MFDFFTWEWVMRETCVKATDKRVPCGSLPNTHDPQDKSNRNINIEFRGILSTI